MSKRNSDGDVILNKLSLKLASHQRLIDSITEAAGKTHARNEELEEDNDIEDEKLGPDRAGIGSMLKEIEDGTFGRRTLTSDDKLLEQIIGTKAARAHRASKQAPKEPGRPQNFQKSTSKSKPVESDDEEEGRSSAFKSKKRRTVKPDKPAADSDVEEVEHGAARMEISPRPSKDESSILQGDLPGAAMDDILENQDDNELTDKPSAPVKQQQKAKPRGFLDEILAERSSKKKKKKNKKPATMTVDE
ncbi:hypothetical protein BDV96DRAFT_686953 [Lophiotrema nucula]|uniref:Uncharacterized protein n=1 Tax=Lophiotrema nucula TaxID=690887 RepID=A0A6A5Z8Z0_9PLEO|nr:hypothetical protein BDV96DRAFT_686953 [Lophiotrema nucula]